MGFFSFFSKEKKETLDKGLSKTKESVFGKIARAVAGKSKVDDEVLDNLEEVLITSDVGVETTLKIIERIEKRAADEKYMNAQELNMILRDEIAALLTENNSVDVDDFETPITKKPYVIMVVGVNGVGKTTSVGKLAGLLKAQNKKVIMAAADTFRAAAIEQLTEWSNRAGVDIIAQQEGSDPAAVIYDACQAAKSRHADVLLCDTAGRLHIDEDMMAELIQIKENVTVHQTVLVVDAMTGQDAVNVAKTFDERIGIDGVILTKLDGDTRGGAALSIRAVTGKPIFYAGMGEKLSDLEQFYPDRMASRILGMGDVLTLIEKAQEDFDEERAKKIEQKMRKNEFDFEMYLESMSQMKKMGGLSSILGMMPGLGMGAGKMPDIDEAAAEKSLSRTEAIIYSMTPEERQNPSLLNPSRKRRIAVGAGVDIAEVNRLVKQFEQMKKMMKQMPGMMKKGRRGGGMFGKLPF